ncbi:RcnB family protein [Candidatus Aalborgicola defluviihabitans]|jgi:Ni/Co efflux regulator RcnB|uniref:RcnB family protein n=1 Tax=Candidatus Aalborgicola defluviihabitans TaxID=3386187 RepID=UPI0039B8A862
MRSKKVFSTVMAVILVTSQVAWAQGDSPGANRNYNNNNQSQNTYDRDQRRNDRERGDYRNNYRGSNRGDYRDNNRGDYRGDYRDNYRYYGQPQHGERGGGPDRMYYRGGRLPPQYRERQYVVEDWRAHRLTPPPRGYQWVQSGGDYLLVAITTGIILSLILGN